MTPLTADERAAVVASVARLEDGNSITTSGLVEPESFHFCGGLEGGSVRTSITTDGQKGQTDLGADGVLDGTRDGSTAWIRLPRDIGEHSEGTWVRLDLPMSVADFGLARTSPLGPALSQLVVREDGGSPVEQSVATLQGLIREAAEVTRGQPVEADGLSLSPVNAARGNGLSSTLWFDDDGELRRVETRSDPPSRLRPPMSQVAFDHPGSAVPTGTPIASDAVVSFRDLPAAAMMSSSSVLDVECHDPSSVPDIDEFQRCLEQLGTRTIADVLAAVGDDAWWSAVPCPTSPPYG